MNASHGSVVSLWRFPVKSMQGEELNVSMVTERGLLGDRARALVDLETGKVASAKNPRKWPTLVDFRASYLDAPQPGTAPPPVRIVLPDGSTVTSDEEADEVLSGVLGRRVTMATETASPSLEEYWPDIEGLAHEKAVTDEAMPEGTTSTSPPSIF